MYIYVYIYMYKYISSSRVILSDYFCDCDMFIIKVRVKVEGMLTEQDVHLLL